LLLKKRIAKSYVLEAIEFTEQKEDGENKNFKHVGYMNVKIRRLL